MFVDKGTRQIDVLVREYRLGDESQLCAMTAFEACRVFSQQSVTDPYQFSSSEAMGRCHSNGISSATNESDPMPNTASSPMANEVLLICAIAPTISAPNGPAPMARLMTPKARPRISCLVRSITMVHCIVTKPDVPRPRSNRIGRDM